MDHEQIRTILKIHLDRTKDKNPKYSLRSLAKRLEINPGSLHSFLNSKRNLSVANKRKFKEFLLNTLKLTDSRKDSA